MAFENLFEQNKDIIEYFNSALNKDKIVHTYLFEGPKGTNKLEMAKYLASLILCTGLNKPCLQCESCLKVIQNDHPNVFVIEPIKDLIRKEQITNLIHEFSLTPLGEKKRVFIINEIEKCNVQSANTFLKFLEDANNDCYGILLTNNINQVLPTIISRSQVISFRKEANELFVNKLLSQGIQEEMAKVLSTMTNNVEQAKLMISEGKIIDALEAAKKIGNAFFNSETDIYYEFIKECNFLLSEDKSVNEMFLSCLVIFFKDVLFFSMKELDHVIFKVDMVNIENKIEHNDDLLLNYVSTILKFKERLRYNINIDLLYAQMFIELGGNNG